MKDEIIKKLIKAKIHTEKDLNDFKREISKSSGESPMSNRHLSMAYLDFTKNKKNKKDAKLYALLKTKKMRSLSGVAVITISTKPYPCPGQCLYCPTEKAMPKSYLSNEPAIMRAILNKFDPYKQTANRIKDLKISGHPTDKIELIVIGGTWSFLPTKYRKWFIKRAFDAANGKTSKTIKQAQLLNEKTNNRIIGLTVETRPDFINEEEITMMRELGVTRVEMGIQSIYDNVLKLNKRGHSVEKSIRATKLLKEAGFKICYHLMPNLMGSTPQKDLTMFKEIFKNPDFQPDLLKIYPCVVLKESQLYKSYLKGEYKPYPEKTLNQLMEKIMLEIPYYCRMQRVIRDIPATSIVAGSKTSNLREMIDREMIKKGEKCKDIRSREVKDLYDPKEKIQLFRIDYSASDGKEIFLSWENKDRTKLFSLLRLRIPEYALQKQPFFIQELEGAALIREVHTYGQLLSIGKKSIAAQHMGLGKKLVAEAERIAKKEFKLKKIAVISGIGVRDYYRHLGYELEGTYMTKDI
ncbi:MAG TPA: tRNA uridine(34) 5-carboxymethylaminomethyl modification radical SAM/GNAT enzyme Elp3 [Candidatus Paceibacterota bacterium]|nr:tRNA uridine(34) 5-carboxymethylaminomethyl modification radical SAM/GNAT enzyme Elp3 [Candidatus Paceibacterota bacterium]HPT40079.1 tRNA uridine(34) 5-carboxymethylaminomethyl modification radical SAM/GNAT enzyme Elp3 [Candidatus Paceibacterota bacterium]